MSTHPLAFLHPYFKLEYIEHQWGGAEEQQKMKEKGDRFAKNWQDEALQVVEKTMAKYWREWQEDTEDNSTPGLPGKPPNDGEVVPQGRVLSSFARHRQTRIGKNERESWELELRRYLGKVEDDLKTPYIDVVKWWQEHAKEYPILSRIALDILAVQASSVPCEHLFSASKQTADYRRSKLCSDKFEQLQIMKFAWRSNISDYAAINSAKIEECDLDEYCDLHQRDVVEVEMDAGWMRAGGFSF
ncbi:hypothetical protein M378DRAFT_188536 [Amanita muscaria Koide BX008]|uniref:HAT C-terminal dimerisation domain-containing protein n=1 Tax=Amanita muscaria (strain Koide BX008) TaxID=946122 RepID=A0A0C2WJ18_AMAMK|nr:hypothetical protein M378DRAFT_188536 [Amanita muscaria Koide BX008]